jgi:hypothetical protein
MSFLAYTYSNLCAGVIMMFSATYVLKKIFKGSKSKFAYELMAFTFLDGAQFFAIFFIYSFTHPIYVGGQKIYVVN